LCKFWYRSLAWLGTQHIQNSGTEDLWVLRYSRSRVFTFLFFLPKILGNSFGKNNNSCRIFYIKSNKSGFAFFWFFYNFLRIFKVSAKAIYYLILGFTGRPLELLFLLRICPWFTKNTLERTRETQCSPWAWGGGSGKNWVAPVAGLAREGAEKDGLWPEMGRQCSRRRIAAVAGGTRSWSSCSGVTDGVVGTLAARVGSGKREEGAWVVLRRRNHARPGLGIGAALAGLAARRLVRERPVCDLYRQGAVTGRRLQCRGTTAILTCVRMIPATDRWTSRSGRVRHSTRSHAMGSRSQATGAKRNRLLVHRCGGAWPAWTPMRRNAQHMAQGRQADSRRSGSALERGWSIFQPVNPTLTACFSKNLNCATKTVDTKVVDETSL
jgi:hypothetical protein